MSHVASTPASTTTPMTVPTKSPFDAIRRGIPGVIAWLVALLLFFPIFWMTITAFKTEQQAYSSSLFFVPTLESFREVFARSNYFSFAWNSVLISVGVTVLCLILAVPAAYAMAFFPTRRTQKVLLWMLSTKMMPSVGVLVPIYLRRDSARYSRGRAYRRCRDLAGNRLSADADVPARSRVHRAAARDPFVERSVLEHQSFQFERRAAHGVHRVVFES
jgi:hypothetical protein